MIKLLSIAIFAGLFVASNQQSEGVTFLPVDQDNLVRECWTDWFDRDNPSGSGDWESLYHLRMENPGKICPKPADIEAQTLTGLSAAEAGDVIFQNDRTVGFICRNQDQPDKTCDDYRVRFSCPSSYCDEVCWTDWFDRDNPSGSGDWELLSSLRIENPGKICRRPAAIEAQTLTGLSAAAAGDVIFINGTTAGFACRNQDQPNKICDDYRVRFLCSPPYCARNVCWTKWFDRDNSSVTRVGRLLDNLRKENPGQICKNPLSIEAVTTDTNFSATSTSYSHIHISTPTEDFICIKKDLRSQQCRDYKLRLRCPC